MLVVASPWTSRTGRQARSVVSLGSSVSQSISTRTGNAVPGELERDLVADRQDPQRIGPRKLQPPDVDVQLELLPIVRADAVPSVQVSE